MPVSDTFRQATEAVRGVQQPQQSRRQQVSDSFRRATQAVKGFFLPLRGGTEEEIRGARPFFEQTPQEQSLARRRFGAELGAGVSRIGRAITPKPPQFIRESRIGKRAAEFEERTVSRLEEFAQPKTADERRAFRDLDIAFLLSGPIGRTSNIAKLTSGVSKKVSKTKNPQDVSRILQKDLGFSPDKTRTLSRVLAEETSEKRIKAVLDTSITRGARQSADSFKTATERVRTQAAPQTRRVSIQNIHEEDLGEILDFIDNARLGKKIDVDNAIATRRLAERFGVNPNQSDKRLATALSKQIEGTPLEKRIGKGPSRDTVAPKDVTRDVQIPKELSPLAKEAMKFRTSDQFVGELQRIGRKSKSGIPLTRTEQGIMNVANHPFLASKELRRFQGVNPAESFFSAVKKQAREPQKGALREARDRVEVKKKTDVQRAEQSQKTFKTGKVDGQDVFDNTQTQKSLKVDKTKRGNELNQKTIKDVQKKSRLSSFVNDGTNNVEKIDDLEKVTTRKIKQTKEFQDWSEFVEKNFTRDIHPSILSRHVSMTMERVAEFLEGKVAGRMHKEIVKPVFDAATDSVREGAALRTEFKKFKLLEGTEADRQASLFAQKKIKDAPQKSKDAAEFTRKKYDEYLERMNVIRERLDIEPIPKRKDYVTHLNELNVLTDIFGDFSRITKTKRIAQVKKEILERNPGLRPTVAFERAKRQVEGTTGIEQFIDAKQPIFRFAKQRLKEFEDNPSLVNSLGSYSQAALRYIHQAENVAKVKAFKDVLPPNAKEFTRLWNSEQVAGRTPPSFLNEKGRRILSSVRGTMGANTILGNMATTMMQLTSFPQVFATIGVRDTFYGIGRRLVSYINGDVSRFKFSRTRALRNLDIDIGLGNSILDSMLKSMTRFKVTRNPAARTRHAIQLGRQLLKGIMEQADQFTVGSTYEGAYRNAVVRQGLTPSDAEEWADIATGKTQANYFKEGLPPFLNSLEGKTLAQFGTFGFNQWEFFKRDIGKTLAFGTKKQRTTRQTFSQFMKFLVAAYIMDSMSEKTFGRQPYDLKELADEVISTAQGESTVGEVYDTAKDTAANYIPFMGSVKFGSMPPVLEFGKDTINAIFASGGKQQQAIDEMNKRWSFNVLLPYGGNQVRKSLEGAEAATDVDLPFVKNPSETKAGVPKFVIKDNIETAKALLFGPYGTTAAQDFFEKRDVERKKSEVKKKKIKPIFDQAQQLLLEGKEDEADALVESLSDEEFESYKRTRTTFRSNNMKTTREFLEVAPERAVEFVRSQSEREQQRIVNNLSDEDFAIYDAAKPENRLTE